MLPLALKAELCPWYRIHKEGIEAALLQMALAIEPLDEGNELAAVKERVTLIEAQLRELKPNLDAIAE